MTLNVLAKPVEFDWDQGNRDKNLIRHQVTDAESEEVFFDPQKKILKDVIHSGTEERYILIGATNQQRLLFIIFTIRRSKIRIISARNLNRKERRLYFDDEKEVKITKV